MTVFATGRTRYGAEQRAAVAHRFAQRGFSLVAVRYAIVRFAMRSFHNARAQYKPFRVVDAKESECADLMFQSDCIDNAACVWWTRTRDCHGRRTYQKPPVTGPKENDCLDQNSQRDCDRENDCLFNPVDAKCHVRVLPEKAPTALSEAWTYIARPR